MDINIEFGRKLSQAYNVTCKSLCQELKLPQTAFDILMFLANNPGYKTASDIVELRKIKANLVSVNVEKLVQEGFLQRESVKGDRRKTELICTPKAQPVIEKGRQLQQDFGEHILENMDERTREQLLEIIKIMEKNLDSILEGES